LEAVAEDAKSLGVEYRLGNRVDNIDGLTIKTPEAKIDADHIINCAGLHADKIAHQMGAGLDYRVIPFRGEYMEVEGCDIRTMIYQPPDLRFPFLSIHLTRETDGRVLAGPSAVLAFGREAYNKEWALDEAFEMLGSAQFWRLVSNPTFLKLAAANAKTSLMRKAFLAQIRGLAPGIRPEQVRPARAGMRAQMVDRSGRMLDDILVEYGEHATHVLNAVSPGMTCSLAFAEYVADRLQESLSR
jgi:L-2-hydroxyglutarate oxidase